jgi:hypothetical protein
MCCKWGRIARETSIKVPPYGILFQCCTRSSGQVRRGLRVIGLLGKCIASGGGGGLARENGRHSLWDIGSVL